MEKIITALDIAKRDGKRTVTEWIIMQSVRLRMRWNGKVTDRKPVFARIDFGRWVADCECSGCEYVDPNEPIFYCLACGNAKFNGEARRVIFPNNLYEIEKILLSRKVDDSRGGDSIQQALFAKPLDEPRCWNPGEEVK